MQDLKAVKLKVLSGPNKLTLGKGFQKRILETYFLQSTYLDRLVADMTITRAVEVPDSRESRGFYYDGETPKPLLEIVVGEYGADGLCSHSIVLVYKQLQDIFKSQLFSKYPLGREVRKVWRELEEKGLALKIPILIRGQIPLDTWRTTIGEGVISSS